MGDGGIECPDCGDIYEAGAFNCPGCEVILSLTLDEEEETGRFEPRETTVIMRMIAPPDATLSPPALTDPGVQVPPPKEATSPTIRMPYPDPRDGVPVLTGETDLLTEELSVFDAYVISHVDGTATIEKLREALGLSKLEFAVVLQGLKDRKVLQVQAPAPKPKPQPPPVPAQALAPEPPRPPKPPTMNLDPSGSNPLQEAIRLERAGKLGPALRVLERAIAASPDPAPLYNRMAIVLLKERRDAARAEELVRKAIELDPNNAAYTHNLYKILCHAAAEDENPEVQKGIWGRRRKR